MVFLWVEKPLHKSKSRVSDAWRQLPADTAKRPASAPCPFPAMSAPIPGQSRSFLILPLIFLSSFSIPVFPRENGHSSGIFRLFTCICPEMMYSIRYMF